jgi:hypothetical protein
MWRNTLFLLLALMVGCRSVAPVHVWNSGPAKARAARSVALAPIEGPPELTLSLQNAMKKVRPAHQGAIALLDPPTLEQATAVRLTSYDGQSSDIGAMHAARLMNAELLLQGTVLHHSLPLDQNAPIEEPARTWFGKPKTTQRDMESVSVLWQVVDVKTGERLEQHTVSINRKVALKLYPDLEWAAGADSHPALIAAARQSWQLVSPTIQPDEIKLVQPWVTPGASRIRKGNAFAKEGRWDLAEREWQDAVDAHPYSKAAWYNLSIAAVAHEDFELAKRRLNHSQSWLKLAPTDAGLVWIERHQQAYHRSFGLPPPPDGWKVPELPTELTSKDVPSTPPQNIDDLPWWTAIPFTKPPGWTWSAWLKQPFTMFL